MPKHLKSEHLNEELGKAERSLAEVDEKGTLKIGVKIIILIAKLIRDIRHNQVSRMKQVGTKLTTNKKVGVNNGKN